MSRVALVTGGTRGIGAAIAKALKAAGYKVAANYGGNDEAAQKFKAETGIPSSNGTSRPMKSALRVSKRSRPTWAPLKCSSTMPALPAMQCFIA